MLHKPGQFQPQASRVTLRDVFSLEDTLFRNVEISYQGLLLSPRANRALQKYQVGLKHQRAVANIKPATEVVAGHLSI